MSKILKGKITISRPYCSSGEKYISIKIEDGSTSLRVLECKMSLEDFSEAITGKGFVDCQLEVYPQENLGKAVEHKTEFVPFNCSKYSSKILYSIEVEKALLPFEVDGWIGYKDDLGNHHKFIRKEDIEGYNVSFHRYV